jgi:hypothetical protein
MLDTFPLALIATVPVPLKFTQALAIYSGAVPETVANCAELNVGVAIVGEVPRTLAPEPVLVATPVPPLATATVPVSCAAGIKVQFVNAPLVGVPRTGVTSVVVPLAVSVPVTAIPAEVIATMVVVPETRLRLPDASDVDCSPPPPAVNAAIEAAIIRLLL